MAVRVDLWHIRTDALDAATRDACARLMTADEAAQHARFVFERNRHEYLVTRALACGVLSTYTGRPPRGHTFTRTGHGRPLLDDAGDVSFNLTNTVRLVACAVTRSREVGVDAEPLDRGDQVLGIVETVFSDRERAALAALPLAARRRRAVELWTLKEAYIKARGLGFSLPVKRVEVTFAESPRLTVLPPVVDDKRWSFATFELEEHLVSTCTEVEDDNTPVEVTLRRADLAELLREV